MTSGSSESEVQVSESEISQFDHTPYYCEENVYFLCKKLCESGVSDAKDTDLFVAFISNEKKQVPLWHQKASTRADGIILWDYHVICIQKTRGNGSQHMVWDLDSSLPFPSPLELYMSETIRPSFQLFADYQSFNDHSMSYWCCHFSHAYLWKVSGCILVFWNEYSGEYKWWVEWNCEEVAYFLVMDTYKHMEKYSF
ncbi:protein N-terminal glutamine amidohydrolase isoform X3 [Euphorbia lathyris]|uniref:protein N-terminal glutamine amidohydrolase isoform X3 n=1 Tax=Euphorbia lathyris TaxID=212925 RepID=UPI003313BF79